MDDFICLDCDTAIEECDLKEESQMLPGGRESWRCCPFCAGAVRRAANCEECGHACLPQHLKDGLCPDCYEERENNAAETA